MNETFTVTLQHPAKVAGRWKSPGDEVTVSGLHAAQLASAGVIAPFNADQADQPAASGELVDVAGASALLRAASQTEALDKAMIVAAILGACAYLVAELEADGIVTGEQAEVVMDDIRAKIADISPAQLAQFVQDMQALAEGPGPVAGLLANFSGKFVAQPQDTTGGDQPPAPPAEAVPGAGGEAEQDSLPAPKTQSADPAPPGEGASGPTPKAQPKPRRKSGPKEG